MTLSQTMAQVWDNRPKLIIHQRLENCASVQDLAKLATSKGFDVTVQVSGFLHDVKLNEGSDSSAALRSHTIRSAKRFLELHPGVD
jgi:hypothetical protein